MLIASSLQLSPLVLQLVAPEPLLDRPHGRPSSCSSSWRRKTKSSCRRAGDRISSIVTGDNVDKHGGSDLLAVAGSKRLLVIVVAVVVAAVVVAEGDGDDAVAVTALVEG